LRRSLDALYDGAAYLAALCLVGLLVMVLLSIVSRQLHFHVPGTDAYAGYLMAASGFLALKRGEHIRVTVLLGLLRGAARRGIEVWALSAASALALLSAFYSARLVWQSRTFNDISTGNDATPLWLPQLGMAVGTAILAIAFIDELVLELRGQRVDHSGADAAHLE
jgi:TRAP-type C4-dicarboxylate transport system permease small subunit